MVDPETTISNLVCQFAVQPSKYGRLSTFKTLIRSNTFKVSYNSDVYVQMVMGAEPFLVQEGCPECKAALAASGVVEGLESACWLMMDTSTFDPTKVVSYIL